MRHIGKAVLRHTGARQIKALHRYIHANPGSPQTFRRDATGGTATKRIKHNIAFVTAGGDNPLQQHKGFLRGIARIFGFAPRRDSHFPPVFGDFTLLLILGNIVFGKSAPRSHRLDQPLFGLFERHANRIPIKRPNLAFGIPKDTIAFPIKLTHFGRTRSVITPEDFVAKSLCPKNTIQQKFQRM